MKKALKQLIKRTPFYHPLRNWLLNKRQEKELREWVNSGRPVPPPHIIKQKVIRKYAGKYNLKILVETGTYYGDMVEAMKEFFDRIYSIELSQEFFEIAKKRFESGENIELIQGDSGQELENVMKKINQPALFWLDGHYSGGVTARGEKDLPIYQELHHILNAQDLGHVILIDDARCFGSDPAYPTIAELKQFIHSKRENIQITVQDDITSILPNE